jgi:hypothetical protein
MVFQTPPQEISGHFERICAFLYALTGTTVTGSIVRGKKLIINI